jgi:hypothetical protein
MSEIFLHDIIDVQRIRRIIIKQFPERLYLSAAGLQDMDEGIATLYFDRSRMLCLTIKVDNGAADYVAVDYEKSGSRFVFERVWHEFASS